MEVDQKYITTIRMHDAKGSEIHLTRKGEDYQLQLASSQHVVNISLGFQDVRRLCRQILQLEMEENWKPHRMTPPEYKSFFFSGMPHPFQESVASWFAKMGDEACEANGRR